MSFQGRFQGLDLNEELYLGGYPNYAAIAKTGLSSGFVGEMRAGDGSLQGWMDGTGGERVRMVEFKPDLLIWRRFTWPLLPSVFSGFFIYLLSLMTV